MKVTYKDRETKPGKTVDSGQKKLRKASRSFHFKRERSRQTWETASWIALAPARRDAATPWARTRHLDVFRNAGDVRFARAE